MNASSQISLKPGSRIFFQTPKGRRFTEWIVLSHHPDFGAVTCRRPSGLPIIRSTKGMISSHEIDNIRTNRKREKSLENAMLKYADVIAVASDVGTKDYKKLAEALHCLPVVAWKKLAACRRRKLI